jgi:mono/diheme cytochrome c family protein
MLADLTISGTPRKVVMQASKNGFFYVLDRTTGQFISATPYVSGISWATHVDSVSGRPVESPTAYAGLKPVLVSPDVEGAHNWQPMAFDALKGVVYLGVRNGTQRVHAPNAEWVSDLSDRNMGDDRRYEGELNAKAAGATLNRGELIAWNPVERRSVWRVTLPVLQSGGVLATRGISSFKVAPTDISSRIAPRTVRRCGTSTPARESWRRPSRISRAAKQYVTVMVGWGGTMGLANPQNYGPLKPGFGRILTFAIGGAAKLTPTPYGHSAPPVAAIKLDTTAAAIREGDMLYRTYCRFCHGGNAIAGPLPDLRYATADVHRQFESIVIGGSRKTLGMPSFGDKLNSSQLRAIQAYVLSRPAAANAAGPSMMEQADDSDGVCPLALAFFDGQHYSSPAFPPP